MNLITPANFAKTVAMSFFPYLSFNGNCREAMLFYQTCFGGELVIHLMQDTVNETLPETMQKLVVEAVLSADTIKIFGSDLALDSHLVNGNRVSLLIRTQNSNHIQQLCRQLSHTSIPANPIPPGQLQDVVDRFGVRWLFYY